MDAKGKEFDGGDGKPANAIGAGKAPTADAAASKKRLDRPKLRLKGVAEAMGPPNPNQVFSGGVSGDSA